MLLLLTTLGCIPGVYIDLDEPADDTAVTETPSDDGGADAGSDSGPTSPGDDTGATTGDGGGTDDGSTDDTGATSTVITVDDLSWRLHEDMESLVYVTWTQSIPGAAHVEYSVDEGEWYSSPVVEREAGEATQLLVGIPFKEDADWRVVVDGYAPVNGDTILTGAIPSGLPLGTVDIASPDRWLPEGSFLLTSINEDSGGWTTGTYWTFIIDRQARPVWAQAAPSRHWTLFAQVSQRGDHLLWDEATYWSDWDNGRASTVHRTYLDAAIEEIDTPGLHHAFVELPDGTLAWGSQYHGGGEALALKGPKDKEETIIWTCDDDWPGAGRCESNGLFYSADRDTFLYSFYTNSSIVEVDRETGESLWWAGTVRDGYDFDPSDSQFNWQHGISYTEAGTLLLSSENNGSGRYTLVREYEVDHDAEVLHEVWSYDSDEYAATNGDTWRLSNGNTLHMIGSAGHIKEVDAAGEVVWHVDFNAEKLLGRGEFIDDLYLLVSP